MELLEDYDPARDLPVPRRLVDVAVALSATMSRRARQGVLDAGTVLALHAAAAAADPYPGRTYPRDQASLGTYWERITGQLQEVAQARPPGPSVAIPLGLLLSASGLAGAVGTRARRGLLDAVTVHDLHVAARAADPACPLRGDAAAHLLGTYWRGIAGALNDYLPGPWAPAADIDADGALGV